MVPVTLEPTTDPVWPEDEALEERSSKRRREVATLAPAKEARQIARLVGVRLPDRLPGCVLKLPPNQWLPTTTHDYYGIYVPTAVTAPHSIITARRLCLQLTLADANETTPPLIPVACHLHPGTEVSTEITNIGEFKIDLGQVVKAIQVIWPAMPDVLTARVGGALDLKRVQARVQATGLSSHLCEWRIADTSIIYNFNPACIAQVPKGAKLSVSAHLRVEVRKRIARVLYKTYFQTAKPMRYVLSAADGKSFKPDKLNEGSHVTLRQPGVLYADEPIMHSHIERSTTGLLHFFRDIFRERETDPSPTVVMDETKQPWQLARPTLVGEHVRVRPGALADVEVLRAILAGPSVTRWHDEADLLASGLVDNTVLLMVEIDGETAGGIQYQEYGNQVHRQARVYLYLHGSRQYHMACAEAIRLLARFLCYQRGNVRITAEVASEDTVAIQRYQMAGFGVADVMHQYMRGIDGQMHDVLLMEYTQKDLPPGQ